MHATHARLDALSNLLEDVLRCFNDAVQPLCKAGGLGSRAARRLDIEAIEQGIQLLLLQSCQMQHEKKITLCTFDKLFVSSFERTTGWCS